VACPLKERVMETEELQKFFNHIEKTYKRDPSSWELCMEKRLEPIKCAQWEGGPVEDSFDLEDFDWVWESLRDISNPDAGLKAVETQCAGVVKEEHDLLWVTQSLLHPMFLYEGLTGCNMRMFSHNEEEGLYLQISTPTPDGESVVVCAFMGDYWDDLVASGINLEGI
jgi:hypothetical protein